MSNHQKRGKSTVAAMVIVIMAAGFAAFMFGKRRGQSAR
jgi:hypothetical protein